MNKMLESMAREIFKEYTNSHSKIIKVDDGEPYIIGKNVTVREVLEAYRDGKGEDYLLAKGLTKEEIEETFNYIIKLINKAFGGN